MQKLIVIILLCALTQYTVGQQISDTQKNQYPILKTKAVNKRSYGVYGSFCKVYDMGGVIVPLPLNYAGISGGSSYSEYNLNKSSGWGGSGGVEFMTNEYWRWYGELSLGISYYSYTSSANETTISTYRYMPGTYISQSVINNINCYTLIDFSFQNYLRFFESNTDRLGLGLGAIISFNTFNNIPESPLFNEDIPPLCLFVSPSIRYDIALFPHISSSIEPYYNYEIRSVANTYPRLASFGLKLSLLFN